MRPIPCVCPMPNWAPQLVGIGTVELECFEIRDVFEGKMNVHQQLRWKWRRTAVACAIAWRQQLGVERHLA